MSEPTLDLSEIIDMYKQDARLSVQRMQAAAQCWDEVVQGGPACLQLRKLAHQLRGSGRTYGFRNVTRIGKALERAMIYVQSKRMKADDPRLHPFVTKCLDSLANVFKA